MEKKAQAALEYLMTYGWALIMIATVIGVLVFIVGSPASEIVFNSSDPTKFVVKGSSIEGAEMTVILQNTTGGEITITGFGKADSYTDCIIDGHDPNSGVVPAGQPMRIECQLDPNIDLGSLMIRYRDSVGLERSVNVIAGGEGSDTVGGTIEMLGSNLIGNSGFDSTASGWAMQDHSGRTSTTRVFGNECNGGSGGCVKVISNVASGDTAWKVYTSNKISVTAGKQYRFGYWSRHTQQLTLPANNHWGHRIRWFDNANTLLEEGQFLMGMINEVWHYESKSITAPVGATKVEIVFGNDNKNMALADYVYIDDISFKEVLS